MRVDQVTYHNTGCKRLFYIASSVQVSTVVADCFPAAIRAKDVVAFKNLEFEVWDLDYEFKHFGKYCFVVFEDGLKTIILIVTII